MLRYTKIRFYEKTARTLVNIRKIEVILRYAKKNKSAHGLPRQCLRNVAKAMILLGFLDGNVEFTPLEDRIGIVRIVKTWDESCVFF